MPGPYLLGVLPGILKILLGQVPLIYGIGNLTCNGSLGSFLQEP